MSDYTPTQDDLANLKRLLHEHQEISEAAKALCRYYERSLNVGPLQGRGKNPTRESAMWQRLRAACGIDGQ